MLHANLRYYFAKAITLIRGQPNLMDLQERRERYCKQMLPLLAVELHARGCRLYARNPAAENPLDFKGPDENGHLSVWVAHRNAPNVHFGYNFDVEWNETLETTGRRASFKIEAWSSRKRTIIHYGDMRAAPDSPVNQQCIEKDVARIADFVSSEAIAFAREFPRHNPD